MWKKTLTLGFAMVNWRKWSQRNKDRKNIPTPLKNPLKGLFRPFLAKIIRIFKKNKRSFKDPFLYLGIISVILFLVLAFSPQSLLAKINSPEIAKNFQASLSNLNLMKDFLSVQADSQSKNDKPFIGPIQNSFEESPNLLLIQKSSLIAVSSPVLVMPKTLGSLAGNLEGDLTNSFRKEITEYAVQSGDTLASLADKFGISLETLLWANNLNKTSKIKPGQTLVILPVTGIIHHVKKGDTIAAIAKTYKSEVGKIIAFNELSEEGDIFIGDILIIPDGIMPPAPKRQIATQSSPPDQIPITSSYFIVPVSSPYLISQGLHWYNAIDFSHQGGSCGKPVYAAAGGEVVKAKYGWNAGAGNNISILHPNGVVTVYYHLQTILVKPGQKVLTGEQIGTMGNTGITTGCHLHFSVSGAKNPFAK